MSNPINPAHYMDNGYGMEVIDMMVAMFGREKTINYCRLNAFKYRMRAGKKDSNPVEQELAKEQWYIAKAKELSMKAKDSAVAQVRDSAPKPAAALAKKRGRKVSIWTPKRIEELRTMRDKSVAKLAAHFGVTETAIYTARSIFGIAKKYSKTPKTPSQKAVKLPKNEPDGGSYEVQRDRHEVAKRAAAKYGAKATRGKVSVRVDGRTTVLMSPKKAAEFKRKQQEVQHEIL